MKKLILIVLLFSPIVCFAQSDSLRWQYSVTKDQMDGRVTRSAIIYSENNEQFQFPYAGGSRGWILIRNTDPGGKGRYQVYFGVTKGQISGMNADGGVLRERFDNSPVKYATFSIAADDNSAVSLSGTLGRNKNYFTRLLSGKNLLIEAPIYNQGDVIFRFNIAGLNGSRL